MSYHCLEGFRLTLSKKIIKTNNVIKIGGHFLEESLKNHVHVFSKILLKILIIYLLSFNATVKLHVLSSVTGDYITLVQLESTGRHF